MNLKGTKTEQSLLKAFAGESQARMRYTYFAKVAKKEGYEQIAALFEETAYNEEQHAKVFFKYLEGGPLEITATYPAGIIGTTAQNLLAAAEGEHEEWDILYKNFAEIAEQERLKDVAVSFKMIAKVEMEHEARYLKLLANLKNSEVFKKDEKIEWKCRNCGYVHEGATAPQTCPACKHPQAYFEVEARNY
ncbi:MAG: rubrerythrin family protein [Prevotellaceae bacterium]|jgi:rubrerythrin|nr:rubrerythrin family protein [Prevotellaceae bacterium]